MNIHRDIDISIIIPVRNEENAIGPLLREIISVIDTAVHVKTEIIVIDDASTDGSVREIENICHDTKVKKKESSENNPVIHLFSLTSCSGQARALRSGLSRSRGTFIITMDGDGQHDPVDIPRLIGMVKTHDMICGVRTRRTDGLVRLICSRIANGFRNIITGDHIRDAGCTFRIMRRECLASLPVFSEQTISHDFFFHPLFIRSAGFNVGEVAITHRERFSGTSKYHSVRGRLLSGLLDCIKVRKFLTEKHSHRRITTVRR